MNKKFFLLLLFFFCNLKPVYSHPHVFVYTSIDACFDEKGLEGFQIYWKFDEMFSSMFIYDFDKNRNQKFEQSELEELKKGAFDNLKKFNYFCHIDILDKKFDVEYVKTFKAWIKGSSLYYSFFVPCHVQAVNEDKKISIAVYDHSFYCSVFLTKDPLYLKNNQNFEISYEVKRNPEKAYYFNQIVPKDITLKFRRKNE